MTPRKSESTRLVLRLTYDDADALSASLVTEAEFTHVGDSIEVWNSQIAL